MEKKMKVGILGCGVMGGFILDAFISGKMENAELVMISNRSVRPVELKKALDHGIKWVQDPKALLLAGLDVVVEAASHEALETWGPEILKAGIDLIPASIGALVDNDLLENLIRAAAESG